jgi:hypothetical protein
MDSNDRRLRDDAWLKQNGFPTIAELLAERDPDCPGSPVSRDSSGLRTRQLVVPPARPQLPVPGRQTRSRRRDMQNLTVTLPPHIVAWVRVRAAQGQTSISHLIAEVVRDMMFQEEGYQRAMRRFLAEEPVPLGGEPTSLGGEPTSPAGRAGVPRSE